MHPDALGERGATAALRFAAAYVYDVDHTTSAAAFGIAVLIDPGHAPMPGGGPTTAVLSESRERRNLTASRPRFATNSVDEVAGSSSSTTR